MLGSDHRCIACQRIADWVSDYMSPDDLSDDPQIGALATPPRIGHFGGVWRHPLPGSGPGSGAGKFREIPGARGGARGAIFAPPKTPIFGPILGGFWGSKTPLY